MSLRYIHPGIHLILCHCNFPIETSLCFYLDCFYLESYIVLLHRDAVKMKHYSNVIKPETDRDSPKLRFPTAVPSSVGKGNVYHSFQ